MRILIIAPHMDDEILGVGGTIAKHVETGDEVYVCFVSNRVYNHKYDEKRNQIEIACALNAKKVLGYKDAKFLHLHDERLDICIQDILIPLEGYIIEINPEWVYVNHGGDNNQDHKPVFVAAMIALRSFAMPDVKKILCYETPSSTEQSPRFQHMAFLPNYYVNIEKYLALKVTALKCYETELRAFPHPRSSEGAEVWAKKRGMEVGFNAAEAFMIVRDKWD